MFANSVGPFVIRAAAIWISSTTLRNAKNHKGSIWSVPGLGENVPNIVGSTR
ncbi:Hypothetical protein FKW44_021389 [Caligus rogercresseyi]|uniref:Uncharacterized protein n=1 Tax=Caligus rogercresseyi TaxID=217165 RepID=A0A7T8JW40_CALRO|nr:Hypothetical protein FKW44_021389 [Caligus rogercresseyi]